VYKKVRKIDTFYDPNKVIQITIYLFGVLCKNSLLYHLNNHTYV